MTYLIDSDWVVDYLKGQPAAVAFVDGLRPDGIAVSAVTVAEVYEGIFRGGAAARDEALLLSFLRGIRVSTVDRRVARRFALARSYLRDIGQMIGDPDIFIAATALQHDLILVTLNVRHFQRIPGLKLYPSE